jgi:hypothetical protein
MADAAIPGRDPTEELTTLLRRRFVGDGFGVSSVFATNVGWTTGGSARRADAISISMYPSRGLQIQGFELKVSRSDWLSELKDPAKAEQFASVVDFWWLVVSDVRIVRADLPIGWGLMAQSGDRLRVVEQAMRRDRQPMQWPQVVALTRAVGFEATRLAESELARSALERRQDADDRLAYETMRAKITTLEGVLREYREATGIDLTGTRWRGPIPSEAREIGRAVKRLMEDERTLEKAEARLARVQQEAEGLADWVRSRRSAQ